MGDHRARRRLDGPGGLTQGGARLWPGHDQRVGRHLERALGAPPGVACRPHRRRLTLVLLRLQPEVRGCESLEVGRCVLGAREQFAHVGLDERFFAQADVFGGWWIAFGARRDDGQRARLDDVALDLHLAAANDVGELPWLLSGHGSGRVGARDLEQAPGVGAQRPDAQPGFVLPGVGPGAHEAGVLLAEPVPNRGERHARRVDGYEHRSAVDPVASAQC